MGDGGRSIEEKCSICECMHTERSKCEINKCRNTWGNVNVCAREKWREEEMLDFRRCCWEEKPAFFSPSALFPLGLNGKGEGKVAVGA